MFMTLHDIFIVGLVYLVGASSAYFYISARKKNKNNLQILNNNVMIEEETSDDNFEDNIRSNVVDQLSRQKLVYSEKDNCWIRLRQLN
tara:strand:- start:1 stop:264 length:264 start_codon:yes stop_codon:yes gene_type:complete